MSRGNDRVSEVTDTEVRSAYRELAHERAPAALNDAVLAFARDQVRRKSRASRQVLQPLALAAAVCLALAISLDFSRPPDSGLPGTSSSDEMPMAEKFQGGSGSPAATQPETRLQSGSEAAPAANRSSKFSAPPVGQECDELSRRGPESWILCIERLETEGLNADAESERKLLLERFPDARLSGQ